MLKGYTGSLIVNRSICTGKETDSHYDACDFEHEKKMKLNCIETIFIAS
jgi:hypothetical protein